MQMDEFTSTRNGTVLIENNKFKCSAINLWYSHIWSDAMPTKEDKSYLLSSSSKSVMHARVGTPHPPHTHTHTHTMSVNHTTYIIKQRFPKCDP